MKNYAKSEFQSLTPPNHHLASTPKFSFSLPRIPAVADAETWFVFWVYFRFHSRPCHCWTMLEAFVKLQQRAFVQLIVVMIVGILVRVPSSFLPSIDLRLNLTKISWIFQNHMKIKKKFEENYLIFVNVFPVFQNVWWWYFGIWLSWHVIR